MTQEQFLNFRETIEWGSYGKNGDEPLKKILIKDISNDHLEHIIPFIEERSYAYTPDILKLMILEKKYREENKIFIRDYGQKIGSFIKGKK
jgi:hypothetical protein